MCIRDRSVNVLDEKYPGISFSPDRNGDTKLIATPERVFIFNLHLYDYKIYSLFMQLNKTDVFGDEKLMPRMFKIMLVVSVVYNSLEIALIIPDKKLFKTSMNLMNTVRLIMHQNTLPGDIIYT